MLTLTELRHHTIDPGGFEPPSTGYQPAAQPLSYGSTSDHGQEQERHVVSRDTKHAPPSLPPGPVTHPSAVHLSKSTPQHTRCLNSNGRPWDRTRPSRFSGGRATDHARRPIANCRGGIRTHDQLYVTEPLLPLSYAASRSRNNRAPGPSTVHFRGIRRTWIPNSGDRIRTCGLRDMSPARTPLLYAAIAIAGCEPATASPFKRLAPAELDRAQISFQVALAGFEPAALP